MRITIEEGGKKYTADFRDAASHNTIALVTAEAVYRARKIAAGYEPPQTLPIMGQYGDTYDKDTFKEIT